MEDAERDDTQDWLLPAGSAPPLIGELEHRVDEALRIARASEAAVMTVGAAAIDAAEQARRAAELAERAARSAEQAAEDFPATQVFEPVAVEPEVVSAPVEDSFERFTRHADRLLARLREIDPGS